MYVIFTQLIGAVAWFIDTFSYWFRSKHRILFFQIISEFCFSIHYYLLNAKTGTIVCIINLIREINFYYIEGEKIRKILCGIMILIYIVIGFKLGNSIIDLLPVLAEITYCYTLMGEAGDIVVGGIIDSIYWFFYGIINCSYVGAILDMFVIVSNSIILWKRRKY